MTVEEILAEYENLERADILVVWAFVTCLSQVKHMQPMAVCSLSLTHISRVV